MFGKYMSVVAIDAERDAQRRRDEAFRELMARPDAEPQPARIVARRRSRASAGASLGRLVAGLMAFGRRRPTRDALNR
jgi:hypothetical protein